jgi:hypothetical protein
VDALPVKHNGKTKDGRPTKKKVLRDYQDDTPRAFAQLMQLRKTGKGYKGLDDGRQPKTASKRKRDAIATSINEDRANDEADAPSTLKIQPGERLTDYAARVDYALPVSGLIAKHNKVEGESGQRKTKHEKKLQRLVNNWKAEEARRIEKAQEKFEEAEEVADENDSSWPVQRDSFVNGSKKGKKARRKSSDDEDPWEELKKKRDRPKGIFDIAQAPPQFSRTPKGFKIKDGAKVNVTNVPNAGSLRRQEMLSETRQDVIARYRQMMQAKRGEI